MITISLGPLLSVAGILLAIVAAVVVAALAPGFAATRDRLGILVAAVIAAVLLVAVVASG